MCCIGISDGSRRRIMRAVQGRSLSQSGCRVHYGSLALSEVFAPRSWVCPVLPAILSKWTGGYQIELPVWGFWTLSFVCRCSSARSFESDHKSANEVRRYAQAHSPVWLLRIKLWDITPPLSFSFKSGDILQHDVLETIFQLIGRLG
jgi:hypothetical protein